MIIVNLKGGLGNQLFQYAAGRALSLRQKEKDGKEVQLKLDTTGYAENNGIDTMRRYTLSPFNIQAEMATSDEIKKLKYQYGITSKGWRFFKAKVLRHYYVDFNKKIYNIKGDVYLDGYFQTEEYFIDKEKEIRADVTLKNPLAPKAQEISVQIQDAERSISLHVRRGDYANDPATNKYWGTCSSEYYLKALDYIISKIGKDIRVFVFSDDVEWVKKNIQIPYPATYVSSSDTADYEGLYLMSLCNHTIIANSSFSWWAAWLNRNRQKIVVAPKIWSRKENYLFKNVTPSSWMRI